MNSKYESAHALCTCHFYHITAAYSRYVRQCLDHFVTWVFPFSADTGSYLFSITHNYDSIFGFFTAYYCCVLLYFFFFFFLYFITIKWEDKKKKVSVGIIMWVTVPCIFLCFLFVLFIPGFCDFSFFPPLPVGYLIIIIIIIIIISFQSVHIT